MAVNANSTLLKRLLQQGIIDSDKATKAISEKSGNYRTLPELLINEKLIGSARLAEMATQVSSALSIDLDYYDLVSVPEDLRNEKLVRKNDMLPLAKRGRNMYLAVVDPTNIAAIEDFEFNTGLNAEVVVVEFDKLQKLIEKLFDSSFNLAGDAADWDLGSLGIVEEHEDERWGSDR